MPEQNHNDVSDQEEIWMSIRAILSILRVLVLISTIVVSEFFEDHYLFELTVAIWSLIIGIPLFIMLSISIIIGDRMVKKGDSSPQKTALLHPILERV